MSMELATKLHHIAMEEADKAELAKRNGDQKQARKHLANAFAIERQASCFVDVEPSRSIMRRSAVFLAWEAGLILEAKEMARLCLRGDTPDWIRDELQKFVG